jgi:hypothetical protein
VDGFTTLADPPRGVPLLVRCRVRFGGFLNQIGWILLGFGLIFFRIFAGNADVSGWRDFSGELETTPGTVTAVKKTNFSVGGDGDHDGTPVYAFHYAFTAGGMRHEGVSYEAGGDTTMGQEVTVEFPPGKPGTSRIQGMRRAPLGCWVVPFTAIFPFFGLCFVAFGWLRGGRGIRLLRNGVLSLGQLESKEATGSEVNERPVYRLVFGFVVDGFTYKVTTKTHQPEFLEDEKKEPLLYDPDDPSRAVMLDGLPGRPRIDELGLIRVDSTATALRVLILPALTIFGHGLAFLLWP